MSRRGERPFSGHPRIPCSAAGAPLQPDVAAGVITWPPRCYACSFCGREFNSAQALGGHMNIHRRDRARLRTNSDHHSSSSTHHDWPPTAITDRNTPLPLSISSNSAGFGSTHLHPPFQPAANYKYCSQDPSSSVTYNSSPIGNISGAAPPFKLQGSSIMIPASDQRPIDYNSSACPSIHSINPRVICVSNSANSPAALHSPQFPKSSSFITSPELMKGTPLNADLLICGAAEAAASRASRSSHVGVAGTHVGVHELIQFKELAHEVEHTKRRSTGEGLLNNPIQRPLQQYCIERPCSTVAKDSDCTERGIPVSSSPNYKDFMGCLDLELRLGRRSCLSPAGASASPGNSNMQPPSPPDHDRRPP